MTNCTRSTAIGLCIAGWALSLARPSPAQVIVLDGMWVDTSIGRDDPRISSATPTLSAPMEALQRGAMAMQMAREHRVAPEENAAAEVHLRRADEWLRANDFRRAFLEIRDGLAMNPSHPALLSRAAVVMAGQREYVRAEHYFRRFLTQFPDDIQHLAGHAGVLIRLSRVEEAEAMIRSGLAISPEYMPLRFHEATMLVIRDARTIPREYWVRRSLDELVLLLNWLLGDREEFERMMGAADYRRLVDTVVGPGTALHVEAARDLARAALDARQREQFAEARATLDQLRGLGVSSYGVRAAIADALFSEGRVEDSLRQWESVTTEFPDWSQAWLSRGHMLLRANRSPEAVAVLLRAVELAPDEGVVRFALACAFALSGSLTEAQNLFDQLVTTHRAHFQRWMESDPVLEKAVRRVNNAPSYFRAMGIPPESE